MIANHTDSVLNHRFGRRQGPHTIASTLGRISKVGNFSGKEQHCSLSSRTMAPVHRVGVRWTVQAHGCHNSGRFALVESLSGRKGVHG